MVEAIRRGQLDRWLSPVESSMYAKLAASVSNDWLAGRIALKQACVDESTGDRTNPVTLTVANGLSGVPYIDGMRGVFCSIGHSAGWGVAAVSGQQIGVDIERVKTRSRSLLRYITDDEELAGVDVDGEDRDILVARIWTIKESSTKAWMTGLNVHPKFVRISQIDTNRFTVRSTHPRMKLPSLRVAVYQSGDFVVALAYREASDDGPTIHWVDASGVSAA